MINKRDKKVTRQSNKLMLGLILTAALAISFVGCGKKTAAKDNEPIKIGILQLIDQTALTDARKGFEAELAAAGTRVRRLRLIMWTPRVIRVTYGQWVRN